MIFHKEITGFPLNAVRELKFLKCLQHKNIVQLKDVVSSKGYEQIEKDIKTDTNRGEEKRSDQEKSGNGNQKTVLSLCGNLYLVFEFVEHDLGGLLDSKYRFNTREVKCIAKQLFEVLEFLNEKKVLHRDIKSSNILITNRHQIKLADFGLARSIQSADGRELRVDLTNNVVTMWYRPPELILGAVRYGHSVDVWSVGCVLAELDLGRPLFPGRTDAEQIDLICRTLGTPNEDIWNGVQKMPCYDTMLQNMTTYNSSLRSSFSGKLSDSITDLLERILVFDPVRRTSAKILLTNKYFNTQPLAPIDPTDLEPLHITPGVSYHEYRTKQQKRQRGADSTDEVLPAFSPAKSSAPSTTTVVSASGSLNNLQLYNTAPPISTSTYASYLPSGAAGIAGMPNALSGPGATGFGAGSTGLPKPPPPAGPKRPRFGDETAPPPVPAPVSAYAATGMGLGGTGGVQAYGAPILPAPAAATLRGLPSAQAALAPPPPSQPSAPVAPHGVGTATTAYGGYGSYPQPQAGSGYGASILPKAPVPMTAVPPMSQPGPPAPHSAYGSGVGANKPYGASGLYGGSEGYRQDNRMAPYGRDGPYRDSSYNMPSNIPSNIPSSMQNSSYNMSGSAPYNAPGMYGGSYYDNAPMYGAPIAPMQPHMGANMHGNMPMQGNMQGNMQGGGIYGPGTGAGGDSNRYGPPNQGTYMPAQDQQRGGGGYGGNQYGGAHRPYRK